MWHLGHSVEQGVDKLVKKLGLSEEIDSLSIYQTYLIFITQSGVFINMFRKGPGSGQGWSLV